MGCRKGKARVGMENVLFPLEIIWERLSARNKLAGKNAIFYVGKEEFDEWSGLFEIPTKEELEQ